MNAKHRIGFYKAVQGAFTPERIGAIKQRLQDEHGVEVVEVDFRDGVLIDGRVYAHGICLNDLDLYFWHDTLRPATTGSDSYYLHLLRAIEHDVRVINSAESTAITNDKLRAHEQLRAHGLPVSRYAFVRSDDRAGIETAFHELGSSVLIKPRFGGWGNGIVRCSAVEDLHSAIELSVSMSGRPLQFLLEQFYDNDPSGWVSVTMFRQLPIIGYRKPLSLSGSDWKIYDPEKRDGKGELSEYVSPSPEVVSLAKRAQAAIGKDIIGFDFIRTADGYKIIDENGRPGLYEKCLEEAGVDLVDRVVELIASVIPNNN